jgi:opacity protein-like surface antigen
MKRLSIHFLTGRWGVSLVALAALSAISDPARALHPTNFPHQHVEHPTPEPPAAPETPEAPDPDHIEVDTRSYIGLGLTGGGLIPDGNQLSEGLGGGGGFEVFIGWRFNRWIGVNVEWATTIHSTQGDPGFQVDSALLGALSGIVRVYMTPPQCFEPYAAFGISLLTANGGPQSSISLMGLGFTAGLGLDIHVAPDLAVGIKATYRGGFLDNSAERVDHLADFPDEASFISLVTGSTHVRLSF